MPDRTIRYRVGNEHNPTDPWGRSELVIHPDGTARLDHFFSRGGPAGPAGTWTGRVDPAALAQFWTHLTRAGFPAVPATRPLPPDSAIRTLTVEAIEADGREGGSEQAYVSWHQTPSLPGYAEAFDLIDAVIRQLSQDAVRYPTKQPQIVRDLAADPPEN